MKHDRPDLLLGFGDPWRAPATGFADDTQVRTPHPDGLAKQSLHVRHEAAGSPVGHVWRASMLR